MALLPPFRNEAVLVDTPSATLEGDLTVPDGAAGIVVFAHGSGSSRKSPRNRQVAHALHEAGLATLLVDLLTPDEARSDQASAHLRFDLPLLAERLVGAMEWVARRPETRGLAVGCYGASTGGGAALIAAARLPRLVRAVVSRGGRVDLAGPLLPYVQAPTLLLVGGDDYPVLELNEEGMARFRTEVRLEVIPGAGHLFAEPGTLEQVAALTTAWFTRYLGAAR